MNKYYTRNELAERLNISIQTVDRERHRNPNFPTTYVIGSKLVRFKETDVQDYFESLREDVNTIN